MGQPVPKKGTLVDLHKSSKNRALKLQRDFMCPGPCNNKINRFEHIKMDQTNCVNSSPIRELLHKKSYTRTPRKLRCPLNRDYLQKDISSIFQFFKVFQGVLNNNRSSFFIFFFWIFLATFGGGAKNHLKLNTLQSQLIACLPRKGQGSHQAFYDGACSSVMKTSVG